MKEYLRQNHLLILTHYLIKTMAVWKKINSTLRVLLITVVVLTILGIVLVLVAYSLPVIISIAVIGLTIFVVMLLTYEEEPDEDS